MSDAINNIAISTAVKYIEKSYGIKSIYKNHIPYMIANKNYLYSKDIDSTTNNEYEYQNIKEENGTYKLQQTLKSKNKKLLKSHLQVCREFASYMFNEKVDFKLAENEDATAEAEIAYLKNHYQDNDLWARLETEMVDVFGVGTVGVVSSFDEVWGIQNTFYDAYCILPISGIGDKIKEAAFIGTDITNNEKVRISLHRINWSYNTYVSDDAIPTLRIQKQENGYIIDTITLDKNGNLIEEESRLNRISPVRLFAIFKPFNRKSCDYANFFGVPIYQDSKDICIGIDDIYNAQRRDLDISENMLLVSKNLFIDPITNKLNIPSKFSNGNTILLGEETSNSLENKPIISLENLSTKINDYSQNLSEAYKMLSLNVGLGADTLSLNKVSTPTATQVISDNGQKFTSLKKHFGQMRDEISIFNSGILFLAQENTNNKGLNYNIKITFNTSDNILVDDETLKDKALMLFQAGLMSTYRYLSEYEGLSGQDLIDELERLGFDKDGKKAKTIDFNDMFMSDDNKDNQNKDDDKNIDDNKDVDNKKDTSIDE